MLKTSGKWYQSCKSKACWGGGGLSIGLAQLSSSHSERNVLSFCGYNLFSLGLTCPHRDLAPGCRSARLARKRGLPREPRGKGSAPPPPTFCPALAPRCSAHCGVGCRRRGSRAAPGPRQTRRARRRLPSPGSTCLPTRCRRGSGARAGMWAAMRPPDKGVAGRPAPAAAAAAGQPCLGFRGAPACLPEALGGSEFFRFSKSPRQMPSPPARPGKQNHSLRPGTWGGAGEERLGFRNPELRWD